MTHKIELWRAFPADGFAALVARDFDEHKPDPFKDLHKRSLVSDWKPVDLVWHRERKSDKQTTIDTVSGLSGLCFPVSFRHLLFSDTTTALEFLPIFVDGEDWCLVNCLRSTSAIDYESSDVQVTSYPNTPEFEGCAPTIDGISWINIVEPQALVERWDALCLPSSVHPMAYRYLLLTGALVTRIRQAGLRGLDFKHVGYIVPDASQAVPKPPTPPAPPPKPSKRKPPKLTSGPLQVDEQVELAAVGGQWRQRLQLAPDASPETILQRLTEEAQRLRPMFWTMSAEDRIDASLGLSAIYGDLFCKALGWSWAELRQSRSKRWIGVVSPSRTHALALLPYVQQQMQSEAPTLTLLFNMIGAGNLPASEPEQLALVG